MMPWLAQNRLVDKKQKLGRCSLSGDALRPCSDEYRAEGYPLILTAAALALLALLFGWKVIGLVLAVLTLALRHFFAIRSESFLAVTVWWSPLPMAGW